MNMRAWPLLLICLLSGAPGIAKPELRGKRGNYVVTEFVNTTQQQAWAVLTNFNSQAEWAPDISQTKVLKRSGGDLEIKQTYQATYTFGLPVHVRMIIRLSPYSGFTYKLIQSDVVKTLQGSWSIQSVAGGVKLKHKMLIDPQVPGPLLAFYYEQQEQNLRQWMTILKNRMEVN